jgi:hypothetical protein
MAKTAINVPRLHKGKLKYCLIVRNDLPGSNDWDNTPSKHGLWPVLKKFYDRNLRS